MRVRTRAVLGPVILLWLAGCAAPTAEDASPADDASPLDASVLMEADRAFSLAVSEGGAEAWAEWFAEDGAIVQASVGEIRGRTAIAEAVAFLDRPGVSLTWEPIRADIAGSGDLGWTTGSYLSVTTDEDGREQRATGIYVSIWRQQADGAWRVVMDLGNPLSE